MIRLYIEGVCKDCPFRNLTLMEYETPPKVRCKHDTVCKFISDPHELEKLKAAEERNTDA